MNIDNTTRLARRAERVRKAFGRGYVAQVNHSPISANPYDCGSHVYDAWRDGWQNAYDSAVASSRNCLAYVAYTGDGEYVGAFVLQD